MNTLELLKLVQNKKYGQASNVVKELLDNKKKDAIDKIRKSV
jgi:hypothetical protein